MTVFKVTNQGTAFGSTGPDRLVFTFNFDDRGFYMYPLSGDLASGYSGNLFANYEDWRFNCNFTGIEHFTYTNEGGGNDSLYFGDGNDVVKAGGGNDVIRTAGGRDRVDGGDGNDTWAADKSKTAQDITIDLNAPASTYFGTGWVKRIEAMDLKTGSGADKLTGHRSSAMNDKIDTGAGADLITLYGGGSDIVEGGEGADRLVFIFDDDDRGFYMYALGGDLATGYSGSFFANFEDWRYNCNFSGIENFTFIDRGGGNDSLYFGDGNDVVSAGTGNDVIRTAGGQDTVDGGTGKDTWVADKSATGEDMTIDLNSRVSTYLDTGTVRRIEAMDFESGSGNDTLTGHRTSAMNDTIDGGDGIDLITLYAGGLDTVEGGAHNDHFVFINEASANGFYNYALTADAGGGFSGSFFDNATSSTLSIGFSGVERFTFMDKVGGSDTLHFGNGNDVVEAGGGNDTIRTAGGRDEISGGAGSDTLDGGAGNDLLSGGGGGDQFVFADGFGRDTITDFSAANTSETINLQNVSSITDFADLSTNHMTQVGSDVLIDAGGGNTITLLAVDLADLGANDFLF